MVLLKQFNKENKDDIHYLYPGDKAKYWVNFNWYWLELSQRRASIFVRLIYLGDLKKPVGFMAYGQHYRDRLLKNALENIYEIYHIVIHAPFQGIGIGKTSIILALQDIGNNLNCERVFVACHPYNKPAIKLYRGLGFF